MPDETTAAATTESQSTESQTDQTQATGAQSSTTEAQTTEAASRPEYIQEQYWDTDKGEVKLESLAKAAHDNHKGFRSKAQELSELKKTHDALQSEYETFKGEKDIVVPKEAGEYVTSLMVGSDGNVIMPESVRENNKLGSIPVEDPSLVKFAEMAQANGLSTQQYNALVTGFFEMTNEAAPDLYNAETEYAKLGDNGKNVANYTKQWLDGKKTNGFFTDDEHSSLQGMAKTAEGVKALNKLITQISGAPKVPMDNATGETMMTRQEMKQIPINKGESIVEYTKRIEGLQNKVQYPR